MDSERRYSEDEVNKILDLATEVDSAGGPGAGPDDSTGLTLRELHEIGNEVGISEEDITRAATSLDRAATSLDRSEAAPAATQTFLGQTIGVGRTVDLPRPLTDQEWNRLVIDLRETFGAKGRIRDEGPFRQWTNSNLQALLEPTETGQRLRLRTLKGTARSWQSMGAGLMIGGLGLAVLSSLWVSPDPAYALGFSFAGAALFFASRLTVPQWARKRARQFEDVIARLIHRIDTAAIESGDPPRT